MEPTPAAMSRRLATARRIKGLMGENDMTQTKLGEILDLTQGPISDRLTGQKAFNTDELEAIAEAFNVPITELLPDPSDRDVAEADLRSRCSTVADLGAQVVQFDDELASV